MTWNDELDVMTDDLDEVFGQASVQLVNPGRTGFNTTTGQATEIESTQILRAIVGPIRAEAAPAGSGSHTVNARDFVFVTADMIGDVKQRMRIIYDVVVWEVVSVDHESVGKLQRAVCREAI